jgi:outer membrane lipoprotein-sorting protein
MMRGTLRIGSVALTALALVAETTAVAAPPDVATILGRMKQALEPARPNLRKGTLTVAQGGYTSQVTLGQARGKVASGNRILTVVLAPADLRGTAYIVKEEAASDTDRLWAYVPAIGRVREVVSPEAYSAFLNSDFTYADLGFIRLKSTLSLKGEETVNGVKAYTIEAVPPQTWYYARIVTAVAEDTFLPIERKFYDPANALWKVERFEKVVVIDGVPTVLTVSMEDVQAKSRTTIDVTDFKYDAQVPDGFFEPAALPQAAASPLWPALAAPVGK